MSWRVEIRRSAEKELAALPRELQERVGRALWALSENPFPRGSRRLTGRDGCRWRVGDYRILYTVDTGRQVVHIIAIGHRRDVYR